MSIVIIGMTNGTSHHDSTNESNFGNHSKGVSISYKFFKLLMLNKFSNRLFYNSRNLIGHLKKSVHY